MAEAAARARQVLGAKVDLEALVRGGGRARLNVECAADKFGGIGIVRRFEEGHLRLDLAEARSVQKGHDGARAGERAGCLE